MNFKRKLAILAVPAILAVAGGAIAVHAATTPGPSNPSAANESAIENQAGEVETANQAGEVEQANETGAQGQSGHADTGDQVDHQATGNE